MKKFILFFTGLALLAATSFAQNGRPPIKIAMIGLEHDHALAFLPRLANQQDLQLAGIVETNQDLIARYSKRFHLDSSLFYPSLEALLAKTNIQAVATFTSTFAHERVVETCAAHGIDVMMEKPLATNMKQAR